MDVVEKEKEDNIEEDEVEEENRSQDREAHFMRACAGEMHMDISQESFRVEVDIERKHAGRNSGHGILREPAQSKRAWTFHKSHFLRKFTGKCRTQLRARHFARACAIETHMDISQEPFRVEIYRKNAVRAGYHLDQTPGLNHHRKNPFSVATLFGEKYEPIWAHH